MKNYLNYQVEETDASMDDVLKLDATAEVDEFSKFLDEFEDEVLADKKPEPEKPAKKPRIETERKVVDGKKLRKKIKIKKNGRDRTPSLSPDGGKDGGRWNRRRSPVRNSPLRRSPNSRGRGNRQSPLGKKNERHSRPKEEKAATDNKLEEKKESYKEREERERREYEERLSKLPTPERERLEQRRKKFENQVKLVQKNCNDCNWSVIFQNKTVI